MQFKTKDPLFTSVIVFSGTVIALNILVLIVQLAMQILK